MKAEGELERRLQVTLAAVADAVIEIDTDLRVRFLNAAAQTLIGWSEDEARGLDLGKLFELVDEGTGKAWSASPELLSSSARIELPEHLVLVGRRGERFAVAAWIDVIRGPHGALIGALMVLRDVTECRHLSLQLGRQTTSDALTGLLNRDRFEARLAQALPAVAGGEQLSLAVLNIDHFKAINDTCGHGTGDDVLREAAAIIAEFSRAGDACGRLGADEMAVLFRGSDADSAKERCEELIGAISEMEVRWGDKILHVGASAGVVELEGGFHSIYELLSVADHACRDAKRRGRGRVVIANRDDAGLRSHQGELEWIGEIEAAFEEDRFELWAQPIVSSGEPTGQLAFETLLRLRMRDGSLAGPLPAIRAAERYGMMPRLDQWVIESLHETLHRIDDDWLKRLELVTVNLSALSLDNPVLERTLMGILERNRLPPGALCIEITETAAVTSFDRARALMARLSAAGCSFALDDFGTGMASFGSLRKLPVRFLKIDGSFVKDMLIEPMDRAMVESITRIALQLSLETIAEHVGSPQTAAALAEIGVHRYQGYYYGRPAPIEEILGL